MIFDDNTKGIAQSYLSMLGEKAQINESDFKVGDRVKCTASGMLGTVTKLDKPEVGKYYTVKQDSGKVMKYAPDELKKMSTNEAMDPVNPKAVKKKFDDRMDKDIDNDGDVDSSDEYLHKRRKAISKAVAKEEVEIEIKKSKMKDRDDDDEDDDEESVVITNKKEKKEKDQMGEASCDSKKMKKENAEVTEGKDTAKLASDIEAYAKKGGGVDKADMMKVVSMLKKGDMKGAAKYAKTLDTDPRDYLLSKMGMMEDVEQVDELSKKTLGSYAKSAAYDATTRGIKYGEKMNQSGSNKKELNKMNKREAGVRKAVDRLTKEDFEWNWDAILEAPEEEIDAMIEQMTDNELDSFVAEFESIEEGSQLSTNSIQPMRPDGRETLDPRAPADRAFANAHRQQTDIKDYPGKDKPVNNAKSQAPVRPGEKRNPEAMKTLSDIRNRMK